MPAPTIYLRVDANPTIGYGHLARQTWLSQALTEAGAQVVIVTTSLAAFYACGHCPAGKVIGLRNWLPYLRERAQATAVLVVMDLPEIPQDLCAELQSMVPVVQFEPKTEPWHADIVVFPNLHSPEAPATFSGRVCRGTEWVILPPAVRARQRYRWAARHNYVCCTGGGGDAMPALRAIADMARRWPWGRKAVLMVPRHVDLTQCPANSPVAWRTWNLGWLFPARLAVIPLGQTVLEAVYAWTPQVVWTRTPEDAQQATALAACGIRRSEHPNLWLGDGEQFGNSIQAAWEDADWQEQASASAQALGIDGQGAERIAAVCLAHAAAARR